MPWWTPLANLVGRLRQADAGHETGAGRARAPGDPSVVVPGFGRMPPDTTVALVTTGLGLGHDDGSGSGSAGPAGSPAGQATDALRVAGDVAPAVDAPAAGGNAAAGSRASTAPTGPDRTPQLGR